MLGALWQLPALEPEHHRKEGKISKTYKLRAKAMELKCEAEEGTPLLLWEIGKETSGNTIHLLKVSCQCVRDKDAQG